MPVTHDLARTLHDILTKRIPRNLETALDDTMTTLERRYNSAVSDWKGKPRFYREITVEKDKITGRIKAVGSSEVKLHFLWTDRGTRPHKIRAKNVPMLRFQGGYEARTQPIARAQTGDGKAHGAWVQKQEVDHPGTEARQFTQEWVKQQTPVLLRTLRTAIKTAVRR